jgi:hypothetical protein
MHCIRGKERRETEQRVGRIGILLNEENRDAAIPPCNAFSFFSS